MTELEYNNILYENMGAFNMGRIRLGKSQIQYKNSKTGKLNTVNSSDISELNWTRLGSKSAIRVVMANGIHHRFGNFPDKSVDEINKYVAKNWDLEIQPLDHCIKGWNFGNAEVKGQVLEFEVDNKFCFEVPLSNVSNCTAGKSEAALEFHQNDDCTISLMEMRFHISTDPDAGDDVDPVEEFRRAVMQYAGIETETDQPIATLPQILCTTPRGRYDIKVYQTYLSFHGKTYDYKIPIKTIMRLFLLPHKDGRHMFFVISLNPPIRQGQTRYHFLVLEFSKDEEVDISLGLTTEQLKEQYKGKLEKKLSGTVYEVVSKIMRVMVDMKITVPGTFVGHSGTPAVMCAHKQASGFLYPLEKGFVYVHKPPMYIRFEEISSVNFARSDVSTRSFDFEIEMKGGSTLVFNSVEKEEYTRLFDFVNQKHLRIRNAKRLDKPVYAEDKFAGSDDELDPYKESLKKDAREKEEMDNSDDSDSDDHDYDVEADLKNKESSSESDSEANESDLSTTPDNSDAETEAKKPKKEVKKREIKKENSEKASKNPGKRQKKKKDPNAPKKAQSAYFLWFAETLPSLKREGVSMTETVQKAGKMWKEIDAETKKKFEAKAAEDKERYAKQMKEYVASGGGAQSSASGSKLSQSSPTKSKNASQAKSKEYVSDSDSDSSDGKPVKNTAVKNEETESGEGDSDSD